jgi:Family of unknown function (DUF5995)
MGGRVRFAALIALVAGSLAGGPAPATADSLLVPNTNWTALLPPAPTSPTEPQPGPVPTCEVPQVECIDRQIERLQALRDALGCDHRAVFATTYLELTKAIRALLDAEPNIVRDPDYLYAEDALFANFYFDEIEDWEQGEPVAPAWRIAFEQAERGQITGAQEMLLGINAHVQNDMPFVIAALGVREPDGTSRKPDHDAMNEALNRGYEPVVEGVRQRYDPTMSVTNTRLVTLDNIGGLELARIWREAVWRNAEHLLAARTEAERALVAQQIEANAALWARGIAAVQTPGIRASRDAYCQQQLG